MSKIRSIALAVALAFGAGTDSRAVPRPAGGDTLRVRLDSGADAFVVHPAGRGQAPAVILVHEGSGLNAQIREVARRLARQGYLTIVPDLFHGGGAEGGEAALVAGADGAAIGDLIAATTWLRNHPRTAKSPAAVVGFGIGATLALELALRSADIGAVVMFYGTPESDPAKLARLRVPLQAHFGAEDEAIPAAEVERFQAALRRSGRAAEIFVYPAAGHAFMNESRASHHVDASRQAWARTLSFLQKLLKST